MFDVQQVYVFQLDSKTYYDIVLEEIQNEETYSQNSSHFDLDERLIDYDMLVAEPAEADRIYLELKERSLRSKRAAAKEQMMRQIIEEEEEVIEEENEKRKSESSSSSSQRQSEVDRLSAQSAKILNILQKSSATERLDFTNSILNFANKQERKYVDSLLPALEFLVSYSTLS